MNFLKIFLSYLNRYQVLATGNPGENPISVVGDALVLLFTVQTQLPAYAASIGLVQKLFGLMNTKNEYVLKTACQISSFSFSFSFSFFPIP